MIDLKILILEDKTSDAELVKLQLEDLEYKCRYEVTDKKEQFIQLLSDYQPDLIISDFNLPRFDGLKALAILRSQDDLTPFIFVTGTMGEENAVEAIRSGATDFIIKQRIEQLASAVIRALREKEEKQSKLEIAQKLVESEQNYKNLFHLSPLPMWVYETGTYKFLKVNEAATEKYGFSEEEFLNMTILDVRPEEDIHLVEDTVRQTRGKKDLFRGNFRHKKKSGEIIHVELQSRFITLDGREARIVVANDITDKLKAEEDLQKREQRFKALVQEGSDLIAILDREGNYLFASDSRRMKLGIPPEDFIGKNAFDFIHPDDAPSVREQFAELETVRQINPKPFRFRDGANQWRWIVTVATNLLDDPAVQGIVANSRDITRSVQQEQELMLTNERYRLAALATNDAIYDWDIQTETIMWGEGIFSLFGHAWSGQEAKLDAWIQCIHPEDRSAILKDLDKTTRDPGKNQWRKEYRMAKANGSYSHVLERGYIIRDTNGQAMRMIGALSDMTETVERETEQRLLAGLSHTLSQPGSTHEQLKTILDLILNHSSLAYAEAWLSNIDHTRLNLLARTGKDVGRNPETLAEQEKMRDFSAEVWMAKKLLTRTTPAQIEQFITDQTQDSSGVSFVMGAPVLFNEEVIGVFIFVATERDQDQSALRRLLHNLGTRLGAELQRKKSEDELNRFFNLSPDLLCIAGPDGYFKKINPAFSTLLGYSEHELMTIPYMSLIHPDDRERSHQKMQTHADLTTYTYENRYLCKDGSYVWLSWTVSPTAEEKLIFAVGKDVTERKITELRLLKTNQQLKTAQQLAKLGYWSHYLATDQGEWSDEVYHIWELNPDEFITTFENYLNTIHPDDRHLFLLPAEEFPTDGYHEIEHRMLTPHGTMKWVFQRITLIRDQDGHPVRFEGVVQDITEKKKLEKERESILESITDGFFAVDKDWTVTYWNHAAEEILQIPKTQILHKNLWDVFEAFLKLKAYEEYYHALRDQEVRVFETHYPALGIWVEISAFPKGDGLSVYVKDITERKQHQHQIFKTVQETQEKERARFGRDMHDGLTQSLTAIKMNLTHFREKLTHGDVRLNILDRAMEYVNSSINESRTISHGLLSVTLNSYGLLTALEEVVDNINANNKLRVTFNHNFPDRMILPKELEINIYRIVQEALNNTIKHSKATEAEILLISGTESIQLVISDNGIGIKDLDEKKSLPGAGLSNIRVRVEGFDGKLTLFDNEGSGLQLNIVFPKAQHARSGAEPI